METQISDILKAIQESEAKRKEEADALQQLLKGISESTSALNKWKPEVEARVNDLHTAVGDLRKEVAQIAAGAGLGAPMSSPAAASQLQDLNSGPNGHRSATDIRRKAVDGSHLPSAPPANGTDYTPLPCPANTSDGLVLECAGDSLPRLDFPHFDGENPKLWKKSCEKYFKIYAIKPEYWVTMATMYFTGNAAGWLQSVEHLVDEMSWDVLCQTITTRFGQNQYQKLYREAFNIRQTSSVSEYLERFNILMNHMLAYKPDLDPVFFCTRFIDGLLSEIRAVVMIQRPNDLDTTVSLSLLQEEIDASSPRASLKTEGFLKPAARVTYPLPPPPPIKQLVNAAAGNNRGDDIVGVANTAQKVAALKSYRRAMGLCFTCGEKWGKDHKCAKTVGLHVVEELLQLFQNSEEHEDTTSDDNPPYESAEDLMSLSRQALNGGEAAATIRLRGFIQGQEVLMLIDSRSSSNFISESLAAKLKGAVPLPTPVRVRIADGGSLRGTLHIPDCEWTCQGALFNADMKVLPLDCYDVILGMEWLRSLGGMYVNLSAKWMCITHMGKAILLEVLTLPLILVPQFLWLSCLPWVS